MSEKKKKAKKETIKPLKPVFASANIIYTSVFFGLTAVLLIALPRPEKSQLEQRALAKFPEFSWEALINGDYTEGITEFYDDTVPYHDELKKAAAAVRNVYGLQFNNAEIHGQLVKVTEPPETEPPVTEPIIEPVQTTSVPLSPSESKKTTSATSVTTTTEETTTENHENEIAPGVMTNGQVVIKLADGHYHGISLYGGGTGAVYAEALNRFHKELGDDVQIYSMIAATSGEYYLPSMYDDYNASQTRSVNSINEKLDESIISVDAISALSEHTDEPIYARTDHHWHPLGAYYAAEAFAEAAGVPFAPISDYDKVVIDGYVGTMYSFTDYNINILNDPEQFVYYKPKNSYKTYYYDTSYNFDYNFPLFVDMPVGSSYSTFMGGDAKIVRIETDVNNGRKLLIFKDSYGNAEIPFYVGSFEEVFVCDMRYFDLNAIEFIKENEITDLLFTMCTFSAVGSNAKGLNTVLDNPLKASTAEEAFAETTTAETTVSGTTTKTTKRTKKPKETQSEITDKTEESEITTLPPEETSENE